MSSPQSSVQSVHVTRPLRGIRIGYCPGCSAKAPKGGYKLSMPCTACGHRMRAADLAPRQLSEAFPVIRLGEMGKDGKRRSWIMYMPLGTFHHPEYGDLKFTRTLLSEVKQHFDAGTRGIEIALDEDHGSSRDNTAATGWIERMAFRDAQGDDAAGLWAYVRWTPLGVADIQSEKYKYFSPEYGNHLNELTGNKIANVPFGGGLTNRPFLKVMPAVQLAQRGVPAGTVATRSLTLSGDATTTKETSMPTQQVNLDEDEEETTLTFASKQEMDDMDGGEEYAEDDEDILDGGDDEDAEGEAPLPPKKKPAAKKMAEPNFKGLTRTQLAEYAERTVVLERQLQRLGTEKTVTQTLAAWNEGTVQFSEKKAARRLSTATITLTPRFEQQYQRLMLSEGVQDLDAATVTQINRTIELALAGAVVNLESYGNSSDLEAPRTVRRLGRRTPVEDAEVLLMETAEGLARSDGKQFREFGTLPQGEQATYMSEAARRIGYRG